MNNALTLLSLKSIVKNLICFYSLLFLSLSLSREHRVCNERELPGEGFSILTRTADTEHKAWRKKQICYKLAKRGSVTKAVTDVILCSKIKTAPEGFTLAGDINGITVCYKSGSVVHRAPPSVPNQIINELENNLYYMNIRNGSAIPSNLDGNEKATNGDNNNDDYELIQSSYRISQPPIPGPKPPTQTHLGL